MKAIMLSIKPKWVAKILNGEKTIEIRKNKALYKATMKLIEEQGYATFFMYCSKDSKNKLCYVNYEPCGNKGYLTTKLDCEGEELNGKVVAKFTVRKVEEIKFHCLTKTNTYGSRRIDTTFTTQSLSFTELKKLSCLTCNDLMKYLNETDGYAYHIEDLVVFDRPKEFSDFYKWCEPFEINKGCGKVRWEKSLTKAPQNFVFVESEE